MKPDVIAITPASSTAAAILLVSRFMAATSYSR